MLRARFLALKIRVSGQELTPTRDPANVSKRGIYDLQREAPRVKSPKIGCVQFSFLFAGGFPTLEGR
jgi:hypothetical protein